MHAVLLLAVLCVADDAPIKTDPQTLHHVRPDPKKVPEEKRAEMANAFRDKLTEKYEGKICSFVGRVKISEPNAVDGDTGRRVAAGKEFRIENQTGQGSKALVVWVKGPNEFAKKFVNNDRVKITGKVKVSEGHLVFEDATIEKLK